MRGGQRVRRLRWDPFWMGAPRQVFQAILPFSSSLLRARETVGRTGRGAYQEISCDALGPPSDGIAATGSSPPGLRVQSSGFRVQGSGFRVQGSGFRVQSSGFSRITGAPTVWYRLPHGGEGASGDVLDCSGPASLGGNEWSGVMHSFVGGATSASTALGLLLYGLAATGPAPPGLRVQSSGFRVPC